MLTKTSTQHLAVGVAIVLASCLLLLVATSGASAMREKRFVDGQIVVKLAPDVLVDQVNLRYGTLRLESFLNRDNSRYHLLTVPTGSTVEKTLARIDADLDDPDVIDLVAYAEPNYLTGVPEADNGIVAHPRHRAFPTGEATPRTKNYSKNSLYDDAALNLAAAHELSKGAGARVAVIDTGAYMKHPDLKARFSGVPRYDFVANDKDPSELPLADTDEQRAREVVGHGTHVAGIVNLVAPQAEIMPLRALNRKGEGSAFHVAEATAFAANNGADAINLSLGTPGWSRLLRDKVHEAIGNGSVVVAAAGNYDSIRPQYPASKRRIVPVASNDDGLLAVTSVGPEEKKSSFSNYGTWVDIAAPGQQILSTYPVTRNGKKYAYWSGTSMATPFVAGGAALLQAHEEQLTPSSVERRIRLGARCLDGKNLTYARQLGAGHADIGNSLKEIKGTSCTLSVG